MAEAVTIALQKSGRLSEDSVDLISHCGIKINRRNGRLKVSASNFPLEVLFLRDDDIPEYVADGVADIGIVGQNLVHEKEREVRTLETLGFSRCRLSIAVPKAEAYQGPQSLSGKTIATTYIRSLERFLKENAISAKVREIQGSTEIAPGIGLADAICDLVSTGGTLLAHGLREVEVLLESEAVLIACPQLAAEKQRIVDDMLFRLRSVLKAKESKYILMNIPNEALGVVLPLLPGLRSPTVLPLAESGWSSVHTVINENDFWGKIDELKKAGAEGILVCPIEKVIS
ncbi:MAG: ATP phosphoribosyltransferase [Bdellovibrionales bacterium]|nr:ATP phosphoribosyltransferase [Bdellovibrionales bacterium]